MNGHIIPGTPIAVDFWKKRDCPSAKFFFLTHLHGDHTVGLSSSWQYNIYCSEITSKLLIEKFNVREALVNTLEIGRSHIIYLDEEKQEQMTVSVIDANHCPGSVMFLFEGYFGKILYTGDFRYCDSMFVDTPLSNCSNVDVLFLDNTYCSQDCVFPTREEAVDKIISIIQENHDHRIIIGMRKLGKEDLLVKIAERFQEWISVSSSMYKTAEILGLPNVFCVDDMDCKIRIVPFHTITKSNVMGWNDFEPTLAILPTCLYTGLGCTPYENSPNIRIVQYSDHSSFEEICIFVKRVRPKFIQPIINERRREGIFGQLADRSDLSCLRKYLSNEPSQKFTVPATVKKFMSLPMTTYMKKVSKQKKQPYKILSLKKKRSISLGVVFDSPQKSQHNKSCEEFETQLNQMKKSFKTNTNIKGSEFHEKDIEQSGRQNCELQEIMSPNTRTVDEYCGDENVKKHKQNSEFKENMQIPGCSKIVGDVDEQNKSLHEDSNSSCNSNENNKLVIGNGSYESQSLLERGNYSQHIESIEICDIENSPVLNKSDGISKPKRERLKMTEIKPILHQNNTQGVDTCDLSTSNISSSLSLIFNNDIPPSEKLNLIRLKPLNLKRSMSVTPELCVFPLKEINNRKRHIDDNEFPPLKKARTFP